MSKIAVLGAGAFGTALALSLANHGTKVVLWGRDRAAVEDMATTGKTGPRLPGFAIPESVAATASLGDITKADIVLLAVPMAALRTLLSQQDFPQARHLVACMKGIEPQTGLTPSEIIADARPDAVVAALTGPSFAVDIARGLPTALTLACADDAAGAYLQAALSTPALRLYLTADLKGAELGGALKNVIAIAAGVAIGAGLGDSARAAVIARGLAEMTRLATALCADPATFGGLSGLGDLVLTATSEKSRNFSAGLRIGAGEALPERTTEGVATAHAVAELAKKHGVDAPIASTISALLRKDIGVEEAVDGLLSRPLKKE